jgi:hypothetical protein
VAPRFGDCLEVKERMVHELFESVRWKTKASVSRALCIFPTIQGSITLLEFKLWSRERRGSRRIG